MQKFLGILVALVMFTGAAQCKEPTFSIHKDGKYLFEKWDGYDGGQRLGAIQEACQDGEWPKGYPPRLAMQRLSKVSRADAERVANGDCDPKVLGSAHDGRAASRDKSPFPKGGYHCWVDGAGRHRVAMNDPKATGWCRGKAVGED